MTAMMWGGLFGFGLFMFLLSHLIVVLLATAFVVWLHWRILARMGYAPAWSLLLLLFAVPMLNALALFGYIIVLWLVAYGDWPAERRAPPALPNFGGGR